MISEIKDEIKNKSLKYYNYFNVQTVSDYYNWFPETVGWITL